LNNTEEHKRLHDAAERVAHWKRWGPYLSERAWGTVREDYSADGSAWDFFPHDQARSKAYRWNEDGIAGICDRRQHICFAIALWNEQDPILKERMFGLSGNEGNHGEDVKELYYYLDSTPTHSYMKCLYKYPQTAFPYQQLVEENKRRNRLQPEFELVDTGIFNENRYFDVFVEYAKASCEDILVKITVHNRGPEAAPLRLLPTIWFRNTWSWGYDVEKPEVKLGTAKDSPPCFQLQEPYYGKRWLYWDTDCEQLFTENDTNSKLLSGVDSPSFYVKDGFDDYIVHGDSSKVNPSPIGTKAACHYKLSIPAGESATVRLRLVSAAIQEPWRDFDATFDKRVGEADEFYGEVIPANLSTDAKCVMRQAFAGMMWSKQYYHYVVKSWLDGDPAFPPPPASRLHGRNSAWKHIFNADVLSMPDTWEYPWFAAWDLAFHCIPISLIDAEFAKQQLVLLTREWYMRPNGQLPAYEWAFGDVNPPVHAWAAWRVFRIEETRTGTPDLMFLERVFQKLMLNFTWWVNRKDNEGNNVFEGGFLGLDNIGVFDRSSPLPTGGYIEQSDGTSWMGMYTLNLLAIAMRLAMNDHAYEDIASKFWEHFLYIANAMNGIGGLPCSLWNEEDGFYYDVLHLPDGTRYPMKVRSVVGIIPLLAVETMEPEILHKLSGFRRRMNWFLDNRPDLTKNVASMRAKGKGERLLLSITNQDQLRRVLKYMLDENEFLSPHGIRALSKYHEEHPYSLTVNGTTYRVDYEPAESTTGLFGGNSNWRGPVWMPINFLIIEALQKYHYYLGDEFLVECPTGSGEMMNLWEVSQELSRRLTHIFLRGDDGRRPVHGGVEQYHTDEHFKDYVLFYEYFHGDNGAGIGASHQTGWTGLVAKLMQQSGE
jgi:hypothetical protein